MTEPDKTYGITSIQTELADLARQLGFSLVGFCRADSALDFPHLADWIADGKEAGMRFIAERLDAYRDPSAVLPGVKSLMMLGLPYPVELPENVLPDDPSADDRVEVACFARSGVDYHDVVHDRLKQLVRRHHALAPDVPVRGVVDTAPLLERYYARKAGLGLIGKNTMLIHREQGSWFFLAAILSGLELEVSPCDLAGSEKVYHDDGRAVDSDASPCGSCRACLDACPTGALESPQHLDARRCLSYLTIEHRGQPPADLLVHFDETLFGCDRCQSVCPYNRRALASGDPALSLQPEFAALNPAELLTLDEESFRRRFKKTPFWRTRRSGMLRNAALVLGNRLRRGTFPARHAAYRQALENALQGAVDGLGADSEPDPVIADACRWALEQRHVID